MKNKTLLCILATLLTFISNAQQETVTIPNSIFKTYLLQNTAINTNGDNEIQTSEATAFAGTIDVTNLGISDLTGIEAFTSLTELKARSNNLTSLNINSNTALTLLNCGYNNLTSLNVGNNTVLIDLQCAFNDLSSLDISNNTSLKKLNAMGNNLTSLYLSNNTVLEQLDCSYNQFTSLNISANIALKSLNCGYNQISSLDVSNNTDLAFLTLSQNQISSLNVINNTALRYLSCYNNQLSSLDVSNNTDLEQLAFGNNQLSSLDISSNSTLWYLACFNNQLTSLNIANGNNNNFTTLNTTGNPDLVCIQVDNKDYSDANWTGGSLKKDEASTFSEDCNSLNTNFTGAKHKFLIYPNPTNGLVHFSENTNVQVINTLGQIISEKKDTNSFDFSTQSTNIYFIIFKNNLGETIQRSKIVKK